MPKHAPFAVTLLALAAAPAGAAVVQDAGSNFVAFEAEDFDIDNAASTAEVQFEVTNDSAASNGQALIAIDSDTSDFTNGPVGSDAFLGYNITFSEGGTYQLYVRRQASGGGANSFFVADDFGVSPTSSDFTQFDNLNPPTGPNYTFVSGVGGDATDSQTYTVSAGDMVTFYVKPREPNYRLDRIVFSTDTDLSQSELEALPNSSGTPIPEPLAAGGAAALALIGLRRRR